MATISELLCPVCGKTLTSDEYKQAIEEISIKLGEEYREQIKKERSEFEEQIQNERKNFQEEINNANKNHSEQLKVLRDQLTASHKQQFEDLKKEYEDLDSQRQKNSKQQLSELNAQNVKLRQESQEIKENAFSQAQAEFQKDLHTKDIELRERDIQIRSCKETIEKLKQQMSSTQPERKGDAGEQDLLEELREAFREDLFTRQTRGISEGDIVQHIRTSSGALLKTAIVYDNKEVARVTQKEIKKQQHYKDTEGTDYLLVVSPNIPKKIKNRILGTQDGILLVRRDIAVEIAGYLRNAIIEISKSTESKRDLETKQARVYDYITNREFTRKIEGLDKIYSDMVGIQKEEEKDHQTMWKKQWSLYEQMRKMTGDISSGIDSIIHGQLPDGSGVRQDNEDDESDVKGA
jgi:hypothetical protein